jgi:hypothetical protein
MMGKLAVEVFVSCEVHCLAQPKRWSLNLIAIADAGD